MIDDNRQEENIFIPNYHNNKLKKVTFNLIFYMFIWFRINYSFPLVKCKFITLFCKKK